MNAQSIEKMLIILSWVTNYFLILARNFSFDLWLPWQHCVSLRDGFLKFHERRCQGITRRFGKPKPCTKDHVHQEGL